MTISNYGETTTVPNESSSPGMVAITTPDSNEFTSTSMATFSTRTSSVDSTIKESSSTATMGKYQMYNWLYYRSRNALNELIIIFVLNYINLT